MRPPRFAKETVTLLRDIPGGYDTYGDPIPSPPTDLYADIYKDSYGTAGAPTRIDVLRCLVTPTVSTEDTQRGREQGVITGWTVYAPPATAALYTDHIEIRGILCRITGEVGNWADAGVVINAVRAQG